MRSSNAAVVLRTLVPQAREIFRLLAQAQLAPTRTRTALKVARI